MTTAAQQQGESTVYREPNPMDPWDPFKRWYAGLWPMERCAVWMAAAVVVAVVAFWITR